MTWSAWSWEVRGDVPITSQVDQVRSACGAGWLSKPRVSCGRSSVRPFTTTHAAHFTAEVRVQFPRDQTPGQPVGMVRLLIHGENTRGETVDLPLAPVRGEAMLGGWISVARPTRR